jgi:dihydrofolate synthase/folylpolyglutamate synthase
VVPGRLQVVGRDPLTVIDGAHNPQGIAALVESLPELRAGRRPLAAVVSILDDKDAAAMLRTLLPSCDALICTSSHNPRALPPPTLESLARQLEGPLTEIVSDPSRALARARALAGPGGAVLATGSIYLVGDLLGASALERASTV